MNHTLKRIETALNEGKFNHVDKLLKEHEGSIDNLKIKNKEAAEYIKNYIKNFLPDFSLVKSNLIKTLSNFLDYNEMQKIIIFSRDVNSLASESKVKALKCYLENKNNTSFDKDHQCLKKILGEPEHINFKSDAADILAAYSKCEPGIDCTAIKKSFTVLYNTNPIIAKIMDVSAKACQQDKCHLVFTNDKNYSTKNESSPDVVTSGYYNGYSDIFVSSDRSKSDFLGIFVHELTHYAMNVIYKNYSNPYPNLFKSTINYGLGKELLSTKDEYKRIVDAVEYLLTHKQPYGYDQTHIYTVLNGLKQWYSPRDYDCELVVRYPHMIASEYNEKDVNYYLKALEMYYNSHLIPDMDHYLVA